MYRLLGSKGDISFVASCWEGGVLTDGQTGGLGGASEVEGLELLGLACRGQSQDLDGGGVGLKDVEEAKQKT